ncbi:hypothetical protein ACVXZ0_16585 [Staphylococcus aureus]
MLEKQLKKLDTQAKYGYDYETMAILTAIDEQSPDIAQGVDKALEYRDKDSEEEIEATGAGDTKV